MISKNDKIKVIAPIFGNENIIGQIGTVTNISYDNGLVAYELDNVSSSGIMSLNVFNKYFEKYVEPEETEKVIFTVDEEYVEWLIQNSEIEVNTVFDKCTVVSCKLPNGFVIVESSACVDPDGYDKNMGYEACMNRIVNKVWELEGYRLQQMLWENELEIDCDCCGECCCDEIDECLDTDLDCDDCEDHDCPYNTNK